MQHFASWHYPSRPVPLWVIKRECLAEVKQKLPPSPRGLNLLVHGLSHAVSARCQNPPHARCKFMRICHALIQNQKWLHMLIWLCTHTHTKRRWTIQGATLSHIKKRKIPYCRYTLLMALEWIVGESKMRGEGENNTSLCIPLTIMIHFVVMQYQKWRHRPGSGGGGSHGTLKRHFSVWRQVAVIIYNF